MKPIEFKRMLKKTVILSLLVLTTGITWGQEKINRWSAGAVLGLPVNFFTIKSKPMGIYTGAIRYSYNRNLSFEAKLTASTFYNNSTGNGAKSSLDGTPSDVISYRTPSYGLNGVFYYNLHKLFSLDKKTQSRWLPFVNAGAGLNFYKPTVTYANGTSMTRTKFDIPPFRDYQLGVGTRYYLNANMDLYGGMEYHIAESYYIDGFKESNNPSLDQYLNFYGGVSIKIFGKPWNNLVDWTKKNVEDPKNPSKLFSKWAIDGTIGLPILFTSVNYKVTGMFGVGLRHSFTKTMGFQLNYAHGNFRGKQDVPAAPVYLGPGAIRDANAVSEYTTTINHFSGRVVFNLMNLITEHSNRLEWNHYAILGAGIITAKGDATFSDGSSKTKARLYSLNSIGIENIVLGYEARKYITHDLDLIAGVDFGYNQSKYLDQASNKASLNNHLYLHTGVTYKIGTTKDIEHIDWSSQNYNNYKEKKVIEQAPIIERPAFSEPSIDTSKMVSPSVDVIEEVPVIKEQPVVEKPVVQEPIVEKPTVTEPIVTPPTNEKPGIEKPSTSKPTTTKPAGNKPQIEGNRPSGNKQKNQKSEVDAKDSQNENGENAPGMDKSGSKGNVGKDKSGSKGNATNKPTGKNANTQKPETEQNQGEDFDSKDENNDNYDSESDNITPPPMKYNVIVACYRVNKVNLAKSFQSKLVRKGYEPSIYRSSMRSKVLRVAVISTDDKNEALKTLRRARKEVDKQSWLYIYNKQ